MTSSIDQFDSLLYRNFIRVIYNYKGEFTLANTRVEGIIGHAVAWHAWYSVTEDLNKCRRGDASIRTSGDGATICASWMSRTLIRRTYRVAKVGLA